MQKAPFSFLDSLADLSDKVETTTSNKGDVLLTRYADENDVIVRALSQSHKKPSSVEYLSDKEETTQSSKGGVLVTRYADEIDGEVRALLPSCKKSNSLVDMPDL